ncbi:hypothetical protein HBH56_208630 [Parastagonospora nodorum]|nr:hypothetical protein HBH56_208630 [Parastagonospora nodorum]KAH3923615.1 hypothetical protein HBH54_207500 [Parastagonospora nodorum]KAH3960499.1 hypothetical protein HBH51_192020 [Parastagonospora nodorum]KAH4149450.1 hypothetical protein HBH44_194840 [Parastagonospora nodorum]KAH4375540.1 hypothetical protein HBH97_116290 [Parastagonospora nodorum]
MHAPTHCGVDFRTVHPNVAHGLLCIGECLEITAAISRRWRMAGAAGLESVQGLGNGPSHCIRVEDWNAKSINITSRRRPSRHPDATRTLCRHPSSRRTNHLRKLSIDKLPTFTYPTIIASTIQPPHRSRAFLSSILSSNENARLDHTPYLNDFDALLQTGAGRTRIT